MRRRGFLFAVVAGQTVRALIKTAIGDGVLMSELLALGGDEAAAEEYRLFVGLAALEAAA